MGAMASQISNLTIVYSTVYSGADQRKHQSSASLAFVRGNHWWPVNFSHRWPVTRKMFSLFHDQLPDDHLSIPQKARQAWLNPYNIKAVLKERLYKRILNTLGPRQNGRLFTDDSVNWILLNENVWISIKISLKFVSRDTNNYFPALAQIMVWRRPCDKPLSEPMMVRLPTHICVTRPQ